MQTVTTRVLKIDLDIKHEYAEKYNLIQLFVETRKRLLESLGHKAIQIEVKKTQHGYHIWIELEKPVTVTEALILQFLLGDDHRRCNFNFLRLEVDEETALLYNILFDWKQKRR